MEIHQKICICKCFSKQILSKYTSLCVPFVASICLESLVDPLELERLCDSLLSVFSDFVFFKRLVLLCVDLKASLIEESSPLMLPFRLLFKRKRVGDEWSFSFNWFNILEFKFVPVDEMSKIIEIINFGRKKIFRSN
jgi:hypothetical protein